MEHNAFMQVSLKYVRGTSIYGCILKLFETIIVTLWCSQEYGGCYLGLDVICSVCGNFCKVLFVCCRIHPLFLALRVPPVWGRSIGLCASATNGVPGCRMMSPLLVVVVEINHSAFLVFKGALSMRSVLFTLFFSHIVSINHYNNIGG